MTLIQDSTRERAVRVFCPAKINWLLTVRGRRPDGYHDLDTVFQTLAWGDELVCRPLRRRACMILCDWPGVPTDETNLIHRAWRLMGRDNPGRIGGLRVRLIKRVSPGSGLGGGSSDAAGTLVALDRLFGLGLSGDRLEALAAQLGSDCPFFIRGGTAIGAGRGERLERIGNGLKNVWLVVVYPGFPSPTSEAYARLKPEHWETGERVRWVAAAIAQGRARSLRRMMKNVFLEVSGPRAPRYEQLRRDLLDQGLVGPMLAGSGSAMFGFARDKGHAQRARRALEQRHGFAAAAGLRRVGVRVMPGMGAR